MENILDNNREILAIIIRASYCSTKTEFFTPHDFSQQLGMIVYPTGGKIKPHFHNIVPREVHLTQEVLLVRKGSIRANIFDKNLVFVESTILNVGDVILLAGGGHGFDVLEDTELLEIKQGPYANQNVDKSIF
jgi:hypothetical protein